MVLKQSPRRMSWQMSGLIVWVGLIGAANVSLPRYLKQSTVLSRQFADRVLRTDD
jgi:hypothetical protein